MRPRKKFTLGLLSTFLCLLAMLLAACGGGGGGGGGGGAAHPKAADSKQIFVYPEPGIADIATFDPALSTDLPSIQAIDMVFTGLVQLDDNLKVQGVLAQSWDESSDGLTWTFHLRTGLKFSDGTPLTSKDVAYSIDRSLQPAVKSTTSPIYEALILDSDKLNSGKIKTIINDSLMTPDDNTIVIKANKNASYFLDALTYSCSYVVEKSLIDKYGNTKFTDHLTEGGGEGPWKVSKYDHSTGITFVPNPNYHGKQPQLKQVFMPFYKDVDTDYNAYQAGQVDIMQGIPAANLAQARTKTREYQKIPLLEIRYLSMNYLIKPFDNIHIRQAFALALNKDVLEANVLKNASIATNHIVPSGMPGYNPNLVGPAGVKSTAGDANKAKQLLQMGMQEEGWSSVSQIPSIKLTYNTGSKTTENLIAAMIQMWQTILGVSVKADPVDFNKLLDEVDASVNNPKGLQFWRLGWIADYPDAQDWLTLQFDKGVPNNAWNYGQNNSADAAQQQATQKLMEQADVNPDQNARLQQYNQAEQQLIDDVAWLPYSQDAVNQLVKPCVQNLITNPQELIPPDDWGAIYKSTDTPCSNATVQ
jgi:oligopeptide transport system substrate-binding protein